MCKNRVWPTQPVAQPPYHSTSGIASSPHSYQAVLQPALPNAAWDAFVTGLANSEHTQLSGWATLYRLQGYTVWRLVIYQGAVIVGGVQLAVRQHLRGVRGAYAEWGPLLKQDTPALAAYTVAAMQRVARALRLAYLVLLPPREQPCLVQQLIQYGYRPTWYGTAYTLTQQINVRQPEPVLLKQMRRTLRQSLRQGQRRGTTVRLGTAADLPCSMRCTVVPANGRCLPLCPCASSRRSGPPSQTMSICSLRRRRAARFRQYWCYSTAPQLG